MKTLTALWLAVIALVALPAAAVAQGAALAVTPYTANDCAKLATPNKIADAGFSCAIPASLSFDTMAHAVAATIPVGVKKVILLGYYAAGDAGRNAEYVLASSGAAVGKFQSADGQWWKLASGQVVTGGEFGAKCDGVFMSGSFTGTDDSTAFNNAISWMNGDGSGRLEIAGKLCLANIIITGKNITVAGAGWNGSNTQTPNLSAYNPANPAVQIGNDSTATSGITVTNLAIQGQSVNQYGLKIIGANNVAIDKVSINGHTKAEEWIVSGSTVPNFFIYHDFFSVNANGSATTSVGIELAYGGVYTTAVFYNHVNITNGTSSLWSLRTTGVSPGFSNTWFETLNGKGLRLENSGGGTILFGSGNVFVDSANSTDVLISLAANDRLPHAIPGFSVDGEATMPAGTTATLESLPQVADSGYFGAPTILGPLCFGDPSSSAAGYSGDGKVCITRATNSLNISTAGNSGNGAINLITGASIVSIQSPASFPEVSGTNTTSGKTWQYIVGNGNPNASITAIPGSVYLNNSGAPGNTLWVKESGTGSPGWVVYYGAETLTVSTLPGCSGAQAGRLMVSDATVAAAGNFGAAVTGGGGNIDPVYCDGTSWKIGRLAPANDNEWWEPADRALG